MLIKLTVSYSKELKMTQPGFHITNRLTKQSFGRARLEIMVLISFVKSVTWDTFI